MKVEFITCHYGDENSGELLELLKKGSYTDTNVKFYNDIQYSSKAGIYLQNIFNKAEIKIIYIKHK